MLMSLRRKKYDLGVKKSLEPLQAVAFKGISNYNTLVTRKSFEKIEEINSYQDTRDKSAALSDHLIQSKINKIRPYKSQKKNLRYLEELLEEPDKDSKKILRDHLPELKYKVVSLKNRGKFVVDLKTRNNWNTESKEE
jgi:hypothetical protein